MVKVEGEIQKSKNNYLNPIYIFLNSIRTKIKNNLNEILKEDSGIAKRYITSEIYQIFQKKLLGILE